MEACVVSSGAYCRKRLSRKWGPEPSLDDKFDESKLRMTPAAQRWHPFLRRTKGFLIDYSKKSNSTQYKYLFPDPVPYPLLAPEPAIAIPPLFWDNQNSNGGPIQWSIPDYTLDPPITDWMEPPIS